MLSDEIADDAAASDLRATNRRLLQQLAKAKQSRDELVSAVYQAVADNLREIEWKPVAPPARDQRRKSEEVAIVTFSDLQLGQVTPTYSTDVAEDRVARYATKVRQLVELQRAHHPVRSARVYLLGDLIENELLFPSQPWQVDSSLYAQIALNGPRILGDFLRSMLALFERVHVVSVPGNHGDLGGLSRKSFNPETNGDRMLTQILRQLIPDKRLTWTIPDGYGRSSWYAVDQATAGVACLLWHGHQARRTSGSSHLPFYKLVQGWRSGAVPETFNVSICGHHHVPTFLRMGPVDHYINGTFASDAEYAIERLASNAGPGQWLLFASEERISAQYLVDVR